MGGFFFAGKEKLRICGETGTWDPHARYFFRPWAKKRKTRPDRHGGPKPPFVGMRQGAFMKRKLLAAASLMLLAGPALAQTGQNVDWPLYLGDATGSKFKPLDQINASNFSNLEVAWRFKTANMGNRPEYKLEGTPIEVEWRGLCHRRFAPRRGRAGRGDG